MKKRIKLDNGWATVDENCPQKTIEALNNVLNELADKGYIITVSDRMHQKAIQCLECGKISHNPNDVKFLYCGYCNKFHGEKIVL